MSETEQEMQDRGISEESETKQEVLARVIHEAKHYSGSSDLVAEQRLAEQVYDFYESRLLPGFRIEMWHNIQIAVFMIAVVGDGRLRIKAETGPGTMPSEDSRWSLSTHNFRQLKQVFVTEAPSPMEALRRVMPA